MLLTFGPTGEAYQPLPIGDDDNDDANRSRSRRWFATLVSLTIVVGAFLSLTTFPFERVCLNFRFLGGFEKQTAMFSRQLVFT
ncbi:hypothetical protein BO99DRAFT_146942 [Aspergillus violaceofuscus CBS 115571]|uniref:Uncharacterized protein n=1 Tax=Aspergillus violaceofuscus (strain CBS 115571) TaxID=1450538 RepID=A0A2V5H4U4_ASPV1|nr:hypothetical protein BO99DRAFT_146942 [Aspergillus violaceofuscus CBS 115571]